MSLLRIYGEDEPTRPRFETAKPGEIATALRGIGVRFERWPAKAQLSQGAGQSKIIAAYAVELQHLAEQGGYRTVDVVSLDPTHPDKDTLRRKFLREHTHREDEVRFFAEGRGLFCLHVKGLVYEVLCEKGDLISVPAGTPHWFDAGPEPRFVAIRCFVEPEGWVAQWADRDSAPLFPDLASVTELERKTLVLSDIEGTLSPSAFVRQRLFPYARRALPRLLLERSEEPCVRAALAKAQALLGRPMDEPDLGRALLPHLLQWHDSDQKVPALKELQGVLWEDGYRSGELRSELYPDAVERLAFWRDLGVPLLTYSSGSLRAQELFFEHTAHGDLSTWIQAHFDTNIGSKLETESYLKIAQQVGRPCPDFVFLSDSVAELEAARDAGMRAVWVRRPEEFVVHGDESLSDAPHAPVENLLDVSLC